MKKQKSEVTSQRSGVRGQTALVIGLLLLTAYCSLLTVAAQTPVATVPAATPIMRVEDQLRIRNLQFEQDKKLLEMQRIEARYKELQEDVRRCEMQIDDFVRNGARAAGVDLSKFVFDLDLLKFVQRPTNIGSTAPAKPLEVKPK